MHVSGFFRFFSARTLRWNECGVIGEEIDDFPKIKGLEHLLLVVLLKIT